MRTSRGSKSSTGAAARERVCRILSCASSLLTVCSRLLRTQAVDHSGEEQVQCAQVPPRRPLHQQGHHRPDRPLRDWRRQGLHGRIVRPARLNTATAWLTRCSAHELKPYGITHGLTNWAAAYSTGLLLARRVLKKLELDEDFVGVEEADGEFTLTEAAEVDGEERRPFKVFLDVGLTRTSTGARVFGAMKGCSDGGVFVPHSENRFPGYDNEGKELDAETLRKYIFAGHVAEYMETLADDDEERYKSQFSGYIDDDIEADGLEELYQDAHKQIREDPWKKEEGEEKKKSKDEWKKESLKYRSSKLTKAEKEERVQKKIAELKA
jgi:large subunit ribosomal protein L5e